MDVTSFDVKVVDIKDSDTTCTESLYPYTSITHKDIIYADAPITYYQYQAEDAYIVKSDNASYLYDLIVKEDTVTHRIHLPKGVLKKLLAQLVEINLGKKQP